MSKEQLKTPDYQPTVIDKEKLLYSFFYPSPYPVWADTFAHAISERHGTITINSERYLLDIQIRTYDSQRRGFILTGVYRKASLIESQRLR